MSRALPRSMNTFDLGMVRLICSAKSASDWILEDLCCYNIKVHSQPAETFFGHPLPPLSWAQARTFSGTAHTNQLLGYLELASTKNPRKTAVDPFPKYLLFELGFQKPGTVLRGIVSIPFAICGDTR